MKTIITSLTILFSAITNAQNIDVSDNLIVGLSVGQTTYDTQQYYSLGGITQVDDEGDAYKLFVGYRFNDYISLKGGYLNLGELEADWSYGFEGNDGVSRFVESDTSLETDGFVIGLEVQYPVYNDFFVYGELGAFSWENSYSHNSLTTYGDGLTPNRESHEKIKEDGTDVFYGVGVGYSWEKIDFNVGFSMYETEAADVDMWSVGLQYNF